MSLKDGVQNSRMAGVLNTILKLQQALVTTNPWTMKPFLDAGQLWGEL